MSKRCSTIIIGIALSFLTACASTAVDNNAKKESAPASAPRTIPPILSSSSARQFSGEDMRTAVKIAAVSDNPDYGYSQSNPIQTGGLSSYNQREYFAGLLGPQGQELKFRRIGSCCEYATENGIDGAGLLDAYQVWYDGLEKPLVLYITLYDEGPLFVPQGLLAR